jgi:ABC-type iron transport system FetAB ATPase subunit
MPEAQISALQLHLFASDSPAYQDALGRYEEIRPILKQERALAQHSRETGLHYWRLWRDLRRFRRYGLLGLIDRRKLPHPWGRTSVEELLPRHIQQHIVQLALAHALLRKGPVLLLDEPTSALDTVNEVRSYAALLRRSRAGRASEWPWKLSWRLRL